MIDHLSFYTDNYAEAIAFYDATLKFLGYSRQITLEQPAFVAYGQAGKPSLWFAPTSDGSNGRPAQTHTSNIHMAFVANSVDEVKAWHDACIKAGGRDNGQPGPRPLYHPGFYGAFIIDPNGWKIEACLHNWSAESK